MKKYKKFKYILNPVLREKQKRCPYNKKIVIGSYSCITCPYCEKDNVKEKIIICSWERIIIIKNFNNNKNGKVKKVEEIKEAIVKNIGDDIIHDAKVTDITNKELKNDAGNKFDGSKNRVDLLSVDALQGTAKVLTFGANKYGDRNWENGISFSRIFGALLRHLFAWWSGNNKDDETKLNHLHHAGCCLMFLQHYVENYKKYKDKDDRP